MKKTIKRLTDNLASKRGMTLVEVLVAMTILMIIIFTFTPLFAQYFRNVKSSGEMTRQTYEKASLIERLLSNRDSDNNNAYETYNVGVPLELYVKNASNTTLKTLDFHTATNSNYVSEVEGNLVTTDGDKTNSGNEYTTIYLGGTSQRLVAFPKALTDDFIEKDVIVVPIGFPENLNIDKFHVYYTDSSGNWQNHEVEKGKYYTVTDASDGDVACARFTFYGANETICFGNSPLVITYNSHKVEIEITAPQIIMVGEKAGDGNYYYYATAGVDPETGRMDLIAKDSADLVSAMNDVEWVEKGEGDNGSNGTNSYGYYIMGGDAGQVRRFWRRGTDAKPGNYYWGGDYLYNYDSKAYYSGTSGAESGSYENFSRSSSPVTQATFKKIVRADQSQNTTNGMSMNTLFDSSKFSITGADWKAITSNYFTANVSDADEFYMTIGRVLNVGWASGGTTGRSGMDYGATASENDNLRTWITNKTAIGSMLDVDGYKAATDYEYNGQDGAINDTSLVTITSVGAIKIDSNASMKQENSALKGDVYPTQSYTLYCGKVPAVLDLWGYTNHGNINGNWIHEATIGAATNGTTWYPVGKFGDSYAESDDLSTSVFSNRTWKNLLNYHLPDTTDFQDAYPASVDGGTAGWADSSKNWRGGPTWHRISYTYKTSVIFGSTKTVTNYVITQPGVYYADQYGDLEGADKWTITKNEISSDGVNWTTISNGDVVFHTGVGWAELDETAYREQKVSASDTIWYYGPGSASVTDTMSGHTHKVESVGTALPTMNNGYYITDGKEVDVTLGYLSYPYAIGIQTPAVPQISGTNGSDFYFSAYGHGSALDTNSKYDHSFFSGGLRDNVTMLDIKSYHDDIKDATFSLAGGYTLSYLFGDGKTGSLTSVKHTTYLSQVYNTGIVYIRSTGDGTNSDTSGSMESGKGWTLGHGTNVFHQFYGSDQYRDKDGLITNENNNGPFGWNTKLHRAYFNISIREDTAPSASTSPGRTPGSTNYGINCHPLQATEVTCVNWGQTWDEKPQAMWGTENGTLLSWFYDYETPANSKITSVRKEFESYIWADRYGSIQTGDGGHYDASSQVLGATSYTTNGFISVLDSVNCVVNGDGYWVAVGNCSNKNPADYCDTTKDNYSASGAGTYINVKATYNNNINRWKAIKVSDERINFLSVEYCEGIWYAMGYVDANGNGKNDLDDPNEYGVVFYAKNPTVSSMGSNPESLTDGGYTSGTYNGGWRQAITRCVPGAGQKKYSAETTVMKRSGNSFESFILEGANSMASQG